MEDALQAATDAGIVTVAASGNDGFSTICYPASSSNAVAVGATNQNDARASYSNYSNKLDIVAPAGVPVANAPSARINSNYYANAAGTSLSTPHVAGLAGLIKSLRPDAGKNYIYNTIVNPAVKVSSMKGAIFTNEYGYGRINALNSVRVADGEMPVYRLYQPTAKRHFYTANANERNSVVNKLGFKYEIIAFWACKAGEPGSSHVYRLYFPGHRKHFYTKSKVERDSVVKNLGYIYEGVGFRSCSSSSPPIYRLYNHSVLNHLYTASAAERDRAINRFGFTLEGVGFYAN
jgi:subtilisin